MILISRFINPFFSSLQSTSKLLALKATSQSQSTLNKTTDTLELAIRIGIKLLPANNVLSFCEDHIIKLWKSGKCSNEKLKIRLLNLIKSISPLSTQTVNGFHKTANQNVKKRTLNEPFIKFEDRSHQYRPNFKELTRWPELDLSSAAGTCAFNKTVLCVPKEKVNSENASKLKLDKNVIDNQVKNADNDENAKYSKESIEMLKIQLTKKLQANMNCKKQQLINAKKLNKTSMYCEICNVEFTDLNEVSSTLANFIHSKLRSFCST